MNHNVLEVSGTLLVKPKRTFLLPATLLLPESIPIRSTLYIGVNGPLDAGVVRQSTASHFCCFVTKGYGSTAA